MTDFSAEPAFVLHRHDYQENHYLLDILSLNYGRIRAISRIGKQKTHRQTEDFSPFRELAISGRLRTNISSIWRSEVVQDYAITAKNWLSAVYLNELILSLYADVSNSIPLFLMYKNALTMPDSAHLRQVEWYFIQELALLPERLQNSNFYKLGFQNGLCTLYPATTGYAHDLVTALEKNELPHHHPQLKHYLQTLIAQYNRPLSRTRNIALALQALLNK